MPRRWFWLLAGLVVLTAAACTPSPPTTVKPSPVTSGSPVTPVSSPTVSPSELPPTPAAIPTPTVYSRLPVPAGTPRCHTAQLEVAFIIGAAAAGSVEDTFEMRNKSSTPCWVYGYVGFQTLDRQGRRLPQTTNWSSKTYFGDSEPPTRILLPASTSPLGVEPRTGHAFFNVFTNDVLCDFNENPVTSIDLWPPDEYTPLTIPAKSAYGQQFGFCGGFQLNPLQIQPVPSLG